MKRLCLTILLALCALTAAFAQARENTPPPSELVLVAELTEATGWYNDHGTWRNAPNRIPQDISQPDGKNNFKSIRLFETTYLNKQYLVLEITYRYKSIGGGALWTGFSWSTAASIDELYKDYYVFAPSRFVININNRGRITKNEILIRKDIFLTEEKKVVDFAYWFNGMQDKRTSDMSTYYIFTQYYSEDNVIRFCFSEYSTMIGDKAMEDYYYEVDADKFNEVFGRWIRRR